MWWFWLGTALATCGDEPIVGDLGCSDVVFGDAAVGLASLDGPYACGSPFSGLYQFGPEDVYTWVCPVAGEVTVLLSDMVCDLDLYVLGASCDAETACLGGDTTTDLARAEVMASCAAPGDLLHVVVEGYGLAVPSGDCVGAEAGSYTLSFEVDGVCSALDLQTPFPGIPDRRNRFTVSGGEPGEDVLFLMGLSPGVTAVPGCRDVDLASTDWLKIGRAVVAPDGTAVVRRRVPGTAAGRTTTLQALEPDTCRVSEPLSFTW